jgi:hypothetical protein
VMVATHGWDNFQSMVTGWKRQPEQQLLSAFGSRLSASEPKADS